MHHHRLVAAVSAMCSTLALAQADPVPNWTYAVRNVCFNRPMEVAGASALIAAPVVQATLRHLRHQQFRLEPTGDGHFRLRAEHSGLLLDLPAGAGTNAAVIQGSADAAAAEPWRITHLGNGHFRLSPKSLPGRSLELSAPLADQGLAIRAGADTNTCQQRWRLEPYGLRAEYFDNEDLTRPLYRRLERTISWWWGAGSPYPTLGADTFGVRWTGRVIAPATGLYTFHFASDDGRRLWVGGSKLIDVWTADMGRTYSGQIQLEAGRSYDLRAEMFEHSGDAMARLDWSGPGVARGTIPVNNLLPDPADAALGPPPPPLPLPYATASATNFSTVVGWPANAAPKAPPGFAVNLYANFVRMRWAYQLPNGDVLASAGVGAPSGGEITLLRDANGDGVAEYRSQFLVNTATGNLNRPFGMVLVGSFLYIANTDGLWRYPYTTGATSIAPATGVRMLGLPADGYNNHWTRNVVASPDGKRLYVTVGSATNHDAELQDVKDNRRAAILEYTIATNTWRVYASGLRNPNGIDFDPVTGRLWTAVNERDALGDNLVPDFVTSVRDGGFYGWPYFYFGENRDPRKAGERQDLAGLAITPDLAVGAHTATLGLAFYDATVFPQPYRNGLFVAQRGSWNRSKLAGYRVAFVPFDRAGRVAGPAQDFLTGFVANADASQVYGRPVGVSVLKDGSLLVTDDVNGRLWRVRYTGGATPPPAIGGLMLFDSNTDRPLMPLTEGMTVDRLRLRAQDISIVASSIAPLGSVRFSVNGTVVRVESARPFAIAGFWPPTGGPEDYLAWRPLTSGPQRLEVTPFSGPGASGTQGPTTVVNFTLL